MILVDSQVFDDPEEISIGSMDFDNQKSTVLPPSSMVLFRGQLSTVLQFYMSERQPHLDFYSREDMRVCHILMFKSF